MKRASLFTLAVVVIVIAVVLMWFQTADQNSASKKTSDKETSVLDPNENTLNLIIGNDDAPITITKYGDFQCPFCKKFANEAEAQIIENWVDSGKAKIHFIVDTHIGHESVEAGEAAYCAAEQSKFREYHEVLYMNQDGYNEGAFSSENLKKFAVDLGLNSNDFNSCYDSNKYSNRVLVDSNNSKEVTSGTTPTVFIAGKEVRGAQPYAIYRTLLDSAEKSL